MAETARPPSVFDRAFLTDAEDVTELLLIRHGQQVIDPNAAVSELFDPPLSEQGRLQAKLLGEAYSRSTSMQLSPARSNARTRRRWRWRRITT